MNGSRTRQLRKDTGNGKPGRKHGQLAKAVAVSREDRSAGTFSTSPTAGVNIANRVKAEREKRERNRQLLADAKNPDNIIVDDEKVVDHIHEPLPLVAEMDAERARKDEKNRRVREARAAKRAAEKVGEMPNQHIFKYALSLTAETTDINAEKILHVGIQYGIPCVWLIDGPANTTHTLQILATGGEIPEGWEHITTIHDGAFMWHVGEVKSS